MKLTPWFPMSVTPVRKGIYQHESSYGGVYYSRWDGKQWLQNSYSRLIAEGSVRQSCFAYTAYIVGWRGLAEKP